MKRQVMVEQLKRMGIRDPKVLKAMGKVRRDAFLPEGFQQPDAYGNHPLPIGHDQTISQPFIVAYMSEKMAIHAGETVLEIGTGSGYQAAVLAEMGAQVYTVELIYELAKHAAAALKREGYDTVKVLHDDGHKGWPEHSPYNAIIVTCAPEIVPETLTAQLKEGGRMILPVGSRHQRLVTLQKVNGRIEHENDLPVRFVPMV